MKPQFETISPSDDSSLACLAFSGQDYDCPYHFHPECEILRIDSSEGHTLIGDTFGEYRAGQWYLFGAGLPHQVENHPAPSGVRQWARSHVIQFRSDCLGDGFFAQRETRHLRALLERAGRGLLFGPGVEPKASLLLGRTFKARGLSRLIHWLELLEHLAAQKDVRLIASESYHPTADQGGFQRLSTVLAAIHERYREHLDQTVLARSVGMSASAFSHAFRKYLGMPYSRYLNTYRISQVRRELIETDAPVTEIAFRNGFNNLSHFNRQFLRHAGESPRAFRQRKTTLSRHAGQEVTDRAG
ncbi:MAG: AraC family transcriptional regulator [Verrucomicrobiota bacterium JB024]|nr:AraC family transcriptional regulator [Verrucomicrobiota bacterium JB024]